MRTNLRRGNADHAVDVIGQRTIPRRMPLGRTTRSFLPSVIYEPGAPLRFELRAMFGGQARPQLAIFLLQALVIRNERGILFGQMGRPVAVAISVTLQVAQQFIGPGRGASVQMRASI